MNTIIGYINDGKVYLASCNAEYMGGIRRVANIEENYPFKILKNGIVIGCVGSRCVRQALFSNSHIIKLDSNNDLTMSYVTCVLVPKIKKLFRDKKVEDTEDDGTASVDACIVIAYKDKAFKIYGNYLIELSCEYFAMGKFNAFCRCFLHEIDATKDIEGQLVDCLRSASCNSNSIQSPFVTVNTKDLHFNNMEE